MKERTLDQHIGDAIDAYDDFCADGMDRETAKQQAIYMIRGAIASTLGGRKSSPSLDVDFW